MTKNKLQGRGWKVEKDKEAKCVERNYNKEFFRCSYYSSTKKQKTNIKNKGFVVILTLPTKPNFERPKYIYFWRTEIQNTEILTLVHLIDKIHIILKFNNN